MQMSDGFGKLGVVLGITGIGLLVSTGLATAQRRLGDRTAMYATQDLLGGSRIGLSIEDVADNDAAEEGAVVHDVRPESPASSAGFAEGDVVVEFDGERVRSARQLTRLVQETPAERTVGAIVIRDGSRVQLEVTPESGIVSRVVPGAGRDLAFDFRFRRGPVRLGVNVQELAPQLAEYFGVDDGVLVSSVAEESVASAAGLQAGDVITSVDGRTVDDIDRLRRRLAAVDPGEEVAIGVTRSGRELELTATISEDRDREGQRRLEIFRNDNRAL